MANEIIITNDTGRTGMKADVRDDQGNVREENITLTETGSSGFYLGDCSTIQRGDTVRVKDSGGNYLGGFVYGRYFDPIR
jgi:hypothetical protein